MRHRRLRAGVLVLGLAAAARAEPLLPQEDCGGVYWDLTAAFDTGDRLYARVLVTNEGPGEHSALGLGHWIDPDGEVTELRNGRREGRWQLEADGRRVHIGSTVLDRSERTVRFEVDNDKRGVKVHLAFGPALEPPGRPALDGAYAVTVEALGVSAAGTVWRDGMPAPRSVRGWASLVRTRHGACERDLTARRLDLHLRGSRGSVLLIHQLRPDGTSRAWLGWRELEGPLRSATDLEVDVDFEPSGSPPAPSAVRWSGPAVEGQAVLKSPHLSIEPVDALPRLMQMLYSFRSRPRRLWTDAEGRLRLKTDPGIAVLSLDGPGIASATYLRPVADPPGTP